MKKIRLNKSAFKFIFIIVFAAIWELLAKWINNPKLFPDIYYIFSKSLPSISLFKGDPQPNYFGAFYTIFNHSIDTFLRIFIGLFIGISLGIFYGLLIHCFLNVRRGNAFILTVIRNIPLFALIPLFLLWFGGKVVGIYLYIGFAVFVIVATNTYEAVFNVPKSYIYQARLLGATKFQIFRTVVFYSIQPEMVGSFRNILGLSWAFSLGAEYLAARSGVGYLVYQSYLYSDMGKLIIFAGIYAFYGLTSFHLSNKLFKHIKRWQNV